jgi:ribosomal protein S27AE
MAIPEKDYIVLSEGRFTKRPREGWFEILRRWLVQCPQCSEVLLVVGAHENDRYVCKDCGHSFVIRLSTAVQENLPRNSW